MRFATTLALVSLPILAQQLSHDGAFEWHGPVARGSFIEIRGINGNVRAVAIDLG